jgi:N-acetylneuraminic acid mutarotase
MRADGLSLIGSISIASIGADANYYFQPPPNVPVEVKCLSVAGDTAGAAVTITLKKGVAGTDFFTVSLNAADTVIQSCDPIAGQSGRVEAGTTIHVFIDWTSSSATNVSIQVWGKVLAR